ncbi:MAG: type II toxin-antitoxin system HicB family antitoxin [Actinomycetota bacterium]
MTTYRAVYERGPDSAAWNVRFPDVPGVFTWGRSLAQAKNRAQEAVAGHLELDPGDVTLEHEVRVPGGITEMIAQAIDARTRAAQAAADAKETMRAVAKELVSAGLTQRDAAAVLGISHQRVDQLVG